MKYHYKVHGHYGILFEGDFETADQALDAYCGKDRWKVTIAVAFMLIFESKVNSYQFGLSWLPL